MNNSINFTDEEVKYLTENGLLNIKGIMLDLRLIYENICRTSQDINTDETLNKYDYIILKNFNYLVFESCNKTFNKNLFDINELESTVNIKDTINDKNSSKYKEFLKYKEIFLYSIYTKYVSLKNENLSEDEFVTNLSNDIDKDLKMTYFSLTKKDYAKEVLCIDNAIECYKDTFYDQDKPDIQHLSLDGVFNIIINYKSKNNFYKGDEDFISYVCKKFNWDSFDDIYNSDSIEAAITKIIFMGQAYVDFNRYEDFSTHYNTILNLKKNKNDDIDDCIDEAKDSVDIHNMSAVVGVLSIDRCIREVLQEIKNNDYTKFYDSVDLKLYNKKYIKNIDCNDYYLYKINILEKTATEDKKLSLEKVKKYHRVEEVSNDNIPTFNNNEINYLNTVGLFSFTNEDDIYLKLDLIETYLYSTPYELHKNEMNLSKEDINILLAFESRMFYVLERNLTEKDFYTLVGTQEEYDIFDSKLDLNDKETNNYKDYLNYKKIYLYVLKNRLLDKEETLDENINKELLNEDKYSLVIDLEYSINKYNSIRLLSKRPPISSSFSLDDVNHVIEKGNDRNEVFSTDEVEFMNLCVNMIDEIDKFSDIYNLLSSDYNCIISSIVFMGQALIDNDNYSIKYKQIFDKKMDVSSNIKDSMILAYKPDISFGVNAIKMDSIIKKNIKSPNKYNAFLRDNLNYEDDEIHLYTMDNNSFYDKKNALYLEKNIVRNRNYSYYKDGKLHRISLSEKEYNYDLDAINEEERKIEEEQAKYLLDKKVVSAIDKSLKGEELTSEEKDLMSSNDISTDSTASLEEKKKELNLELDELRKDRELKNINYKTLKKVDKVFDSKDIIEEKPKKIKKTNELKKYAKKFAPRILGAAGGLLVGGVVAANPLAVIIINAGAFMLIEQAKAYSKKIEEAHLTDSDALIKCEIAPTNIVIKAQSFIKKNVCDKFNNFNKNKNIFEWISKKDIKYLSEWCGSREVLKMIIDFLITGVIAMDIRVLFEYLMNKMGVNSVEKNNFAANNEVVETPKPSEVPNTSTPSDIVTENSAAVKDINIGDVIGNEDTIVKGYKTAYDANSCSNAVNLNQSIITDGDTIIKNLKGFTADGEMFDINIPEGTDILEYLDSLGIKVTDVMANLTDMDGVGRAWVPLRDVIKTLGR